MKTSSLLKLRLQIAGDEHIQPAAGNLGEDLVDFRSAAAVDRIAVHGIAELRVGVLRRCAAPYSASAVPSMTGTASAGVAATSRDSARAARAINVMRFSSCDPPSLMLGLSGARQSVVGVACPRGWS